MKQLRRREPVGEYQSIVLPEDDLTSRDLTVLESLDQELLACRRLPGSWEISAGPVVGVLTLDRVVLEVQPKIMMSGEQVMTWLGFALSQPAPVDVFRDWSTSPRGLPDLIVAALIAECRVLLRDQLRRDYRRQKLVEPVLRGRLDIPRQINRRYGQLDRLHVQTFDRDVTIWENLACHAALHRAARVAATTELKHAARDLAERFPAGHTDPRTVLRWLTTARYHRMNRRYRPAHTWAVLLLGGGGLSDLLADGPWQATSLLINMNRLWEAVVRRLVGEAATALGGSAPLAHAEHPITVLEEGRTTRSFRPDVLLKPRPDDPELLPVDAKYKRYHQAAVGNADIHQLLTYAHGYRHSGEVPSALIVHPAPLGNSHRSITVRDHLDRPSVIDVVGLDVRQSHNRRPPN